MSELIMERITDNLMILDESRRNNESCLTFLDRLLEEEVNASVG
ncbi:hypothetical protein [Candidatus Magnetominusculus xianensis]|uniref:Uncharacterized protein n=1 Tax=Candidatus Magnetominusculus xianensis TaxID=1748249 RepID=A0ABR5SCW2_9BACT|nr:hypothetical protein [Candidatus Magnetominusculus xianensis]KWT82495.1 hypothetical protein ASN18_2527 [Candidatus Magnetominusculus xianensis]